MHFVTSFIGRPPSYWIYCIHNIRLFNKDLIWCITDYPNDPIITYIKTYESIKIVSYETVLNQYHNDCLISNKHKFIQVDGLKTRKDLFFHSIKRFFLCNELIKQNNFEHVIFLEIDNMIYMDLSHLIDQLSTKKLGYTYSNIGRCISGIMYIRDRNSMDTFIDSILEYVTTRNDEIMCEMTCLWEYYEKHPDDVQLLPTHMASDSIHKYAYENSNVFPCMFDAAGMGIFLFGLDPYHTDGIITKGVRCRWSEIDYTNYTFEWRLDSCGRKCPWILFSDNSEYPICNLHVHGKNLEEARSDP